MCLAVEGGQVGSGFGGFQLATDERKMFLPTYIPFSGSAGWACANYREGRPSIRTEYI